MGYTTEFEGQVTIEPPLNPSERDYLLKFANTRHMDRGNGQYHVDNGRDNDYDYDVRDHNRPPAEQPGLWCQWVPTADGSALEWDGGEKFYNPVEWMQYIINHFLKDGAEASNTTDPQFTGFTFNHVLNGTIVAQGEDPGDRWLLAVKDNEVARYQGQIVYM